MKRPAWMIPLVAVFVLGAVLIGVLGEPARAQSYDPHYPVCLQTYGLEGTSIQCRYGSMAACQMSASGRAAQCIANPYYGQAGSRRRTRTY